MGCPGPLRKRRLAIGRGQERPKNPQRRLQIQPVERWNTISRLVDRGRDSNVNCRQ